MSLEQMPPFYDVGHFINQQNNRNHQMKMCLERRMSMNVTYTSIMNQRNNAQYTTSTTPSPTPSSSMYWNEEANAQHRRLDRSQSEPCNRTMPNVNSSRYKTELCRPFEERGYCKYSDKCQFAHGEYELKTITRHPKYKTDLCHKYHTEGFCGYGTRCNFIHNENEVQLNRIASNNQQAMVMQQQRQNDIQKRQKDPGPIQRPSSINFNARPESSFSGSSSPLNGVVDSPSLSPTFFDDSEDLFVNSRLQQIPTAYPSTTQTPYRYNNNSPSLTGPISDNVSQLAEITNLLAPLYIQTHLNMANDFSTNISHVHAQLNNQHNDQLLDMRELASELSDIVAPHSPPDSISGDSLSSSGSSGSMDFTGIQCPSPDHSKPLRLPVFTQLGPQCGVTAADF